MAKKSVLGRGLGALIEEDVIASEKYLVVEIERVRANRMQPRKHFKDSALEDLAASIKEKGVIEPLLVRRFGEGYELIAGERRLRASTLAGLKEVPVLICEVSDEESFELALIENIQREELNPIEEAEAYGTLVGFGLSQEEVAKRVGKKRATVANYLRLLRLPDAIKDDLGMGALSMGHARAILSVTGEKEQLRLAGLVTERGLSVRETEQLASTGGGPASAAKNKGKTVKKRVPLEVEEDLRKIFGTKVRVFDKKGKGRIVLEYYSAEERERILDMLLTLG